MSLLKLLTDLIVTNMNMNYADQEHSVFKWTVAQNNIIEQCLKVQKNSKPNYIKRLLKKSNAFGLRQPTQLQLYNKIATVKKKLSPSENILNTFQLRQKISECVDIPESEVKGYIPYWEIIDENEKEEPRFCVVFSTVKNQRKLNSSRILQSDATYRINWMGFPMIVIGTSSSTGKFSALSAVIASNEDTEGWSSIYRYVESLDIAPKYHLADGAKAITKAIDNVFGLENCTRLMCWPHVYRNIVPKLKPISSINKALADQLLLEIENLQWSVHNEQSFLSVFNLLEMKYLDNDDSDLTAALERFFSYMKEVWVESREFRWYEGANPWSVSNNQGVEGKNKEIKQSHTFRQRLDMGSLFTVMLNMVEEWAEEDDILLTSSRLATLHGQPNSLSLKTAGFQWLKANELRPGRILQINAGGKYTLSESLEFMLGKVDNIWAVSSQSDGSGKSLKELAKTRLANRELPTSPSFDAYLKMRSGCWIIEERDGDFFCDCPVGMKGKLCKHTVGMLYKAGLLVASPDVRSVPLVLKGREAGLRDYQTV